MKIISFNRTIFDNLKREGKKMITRPNIPIVFKGDFPENFKNDVCGWNFSEEELTKNKGKLLTLDIDFGNVCSLNCPHCFRRENRADAEKSQPMTYDETVQLILDAKKLGLRSVKFLGAGEPFENKNFICFLRFLKTQDVIPLIFTKGQVLGDDALAKNGIPIMGFPQAWSSLRS